MNGPLAGLTVVEFAAIGPTPLAGQLLADQGARVIVIDRKGGGDISREPNRRGKQSIALDLKHPDGLKIVFQMLEKADVLLEGFRPGVMERLGLGPEHCQAHNPQLIYGRMTGWGQHGAWANMAGHDLNFLGVTGALQAMGKPGEPPMPPLNLVADYGGGTMFLLFGIMSALFNRSQGGKGQVVDCAMVDGVIAMMGLHHEMAAKNIWDGSRGTNFLDGCAPFYQCYACADGEYVSVGCLEPQFFAEFLKIAELPSEFGPAQMDRSQWAQMQAAIAERMAQKPRDEWEKMFQGSDACVAPVLSINEAKDWPHNKQRGNLIKVDDILQTGVAPRISDAQGNQADGVGGRENISMADKTGDDSQAILRELGYDDDQLSALEQSSVLT